MTESRQPPSPSPQLRQATVILRRRSTEALPLEAPEPLTPRELGDRFGADPGDLDRVRRLITEHGLRVVSEHAASRRLRVEGTAAQLADLSDLDECVVAVLGPDAGPRAQPRAIFADPTTAKASYTPLELARIYDLPEADGSGQTVAIIELGGGFAQSDLDTYFGGLGLQTPTVTAQGVDGAQNKPGQDPQGADGEVLLDIEVVGALVPGADLVVYFAPNTDDGFVDAISTAAHADPTPVAISISWGQSEDQWSQASRQAMDDAIADAAALGITVTAAAGDNGSSDNDTSGGKVHTDFPASSPHALGCGGTTLQVSGDAVASEVVWDDGGKGGATGGGVSDVFDLPTWQSDVGVPNRAGTPDPGRGVPDIAADADPDTGYKIYVDGKQAVVGGTSAVAPLWAALVARLVQLTGRRIGLAQPKLYDGAAPGRTSPGLRDITEGSNGAYRASAGWDPCTGLGVPTAGIRDVFTNG